MWHWKSDESQSDVNDKHLDANSRNLHGIFFVFLAISTVYTRTRIAMVKKLIQNGVFVSKFVSSLQVRHWTELILRRVLHTGFFLYIRMKVPDSYQLTMGWSLAMEKKQHPWVFCANFGHDSLIEIAVEENQPGAFRWFASNCNMLFIVFL